MTTQTWHTDERLLTAYVAGALDALEGASVEQHLGRCTACRARMRPLAPLPDLERAWDGVRTAIERPPLPLPVRVARRLGLSDPHAILLAATVSLRTAWLTSVLVALGFALAAAHLTTGERLWPFLLVAPLVPVLGVAASYGPAEDSFEAMLVTTPFGRGRLILLRTAAVLALCLPVAFCIGLLLPAPAWVAAAWLGPAVMLVPVLFALASFVGPRVASGLVAIGWSGVVLGSIRPFGPTWPIEATQQLALLVLACLAVAVLAVKARHPYRTGAAL